MGCHTDSFISVNFSLNMTLVCQLINPIMKLTISLTFFLLISINSAWSQDEDKYEEFVDKGWELYQSQDYQESAAAYENAFEQLNGYAYEVDRYNAACSYALVGNADDAFRHLKHLAEDPETHYRDLGHITTDPDLNSLHEDERWTDLMAMVGKNKSDYEKDFDQELVAQLDSIYLTDQTYRKQISEVEKKYGADSDEMRAHWDLIKKTDEANLEQVSEILDERGWLGPKVVGDKGSLTLFLVIQHADINTQEKYLPMMREAVKEGNARASNLALLEDRVALRQGKRQIYGSQIGRDPDTGEYYVSPLIEPEKVNERRAEVGLGSIEDYISNWDMTWDVEKHKERTARMEQD
jgi:hypothetical protein